MHIMDLTGMRAIEIILDLSTRQYGLVTRKQLLAAGISSDFIERRVGTALLRPVHAGVYRTGGPSHPRVREHAALLACPGAAISHGSAACVTDLGPPPRDGKVHVSICANRRIGRRPGLCAHRGVVREDEIMVIDNLRVTTPARTVLDLASEVSDITRMVGRAERIRPGSIAQLKTLLQRYPQRCGTRALRALLRDPAADAFTRSPLEVLFLDLLKEAGLPLPEVNVIVCGREVDFYFRSARLVVETDGYEYHADYATFVTDRQRDSNLMASGIRVIRLSWHQITNERTRTAAEIALALHTCGIASPLSSRPRAVVTTVPRRRRMRDAETSGK
jgi:hypothetical protein